MHKKCQDIDESSASQSKSGDEDQYDTIRLLWNQKIKRVLDPSEVLSQRD